MTNAVRPLLTVVFGLSLATASLAGPAAAQNDTRGSSDHPLFPTRMPGHYISNYKHFDFAAHTFLTASGPVTVEGIKTTISYRRQRDAARPGGLAIRRNYENAMRQAGAEVLLSNNKMVVMRGTWEGKEVWAAVEASDSASANLYFVTIVERGDMQQTITADAMRDSLARDGFVALDIHFDTGKTEILPESKPIVQEIVALLMADPTLTLGVEGHTDNVGAPEFNKQLSAGRAEAVVAALAAGGIDRARLHPAGHGQDKPIADNRTEAGRAKNRRVELVKR